MLRLNRRYAAWDAWMHLCCKELEDCGVLDFDLRIAEDSHKSGREDICGIKE